MVCASIFAGWCRLQSLPGYACGAIFCATPRLWAERLIYTWAHRGLVNFGLRSTVQTLAILTSGLNETRRISCVGCR